MRMILDLYMSLTDRQLLAVEIGQLVVWLLVGSFLYKDYGMLDMLTSTDEMRRIIGRMAMVPIVLVAVKMLDLIARTV